MKTQKCSCKISLLLLIFLDAILLGASVSRAETKEVLQGSPRPFWGDEKKLEHARSFFKFDEYEKKAPRYKSAITNWVPKLTSCNGITNISIYTNSESSPSPSIISYSGSGSNCWLRIRILVFSSSSDAHDYLIKSFADLPYGLPKTSNEVFDSSRKLGYRCFWSEKGRTEMVEFIRNNFYIRAGGVNVKIEPFARELDQQICALSELSGGGNPVAPQGTNDAGSALSGKDPKK